MIKRLLVVIGALVPMVALLGLTTANSSVWRDLREVERATAQYRDISAAEAAGYGEFRDAQGIACIALEGVGGMGVHYVNGALVGDAVLDPLRPESLVYAPGRGGNLKLAAVEYIVFKEVWEAAGNLEPPSLFGVEFDLVPSPNRFGIPAFYALHAWIFRNNQAGTFAPWNPKVTC